MAVPLKLFQKTQEQERTVRLNVIKTRPKTIEQKEDDKQIDRLIGKSISSSQAVAS